MYLYTSPQWRGLPIYRWGHQHILARDCLWFPTKTRAIGQFGGGPWLLSFSYTQGSLTTLLAFPQQADPSMFPWGFLLLFFQDLRTSCNEVSRVFYLLWKPVISDAFSFGVLREMSQDHVFSNCQSLIVFMLLKIIWRFELSLVLSFLFLFLTRWRCLSHQKDKIACGWWWHILFVQHISEITNCLWQWLPVRVMLPVSLLSIPDACFWSNGVFFQKIKIVVFYSHWRWSILYFVVLETCTRVSSWSNLLINHIATNAIRVVNFHVDLWQGSLV